jgi:hypothetical protein
LGGRSEKEKTKPLKSPPASVIFLFCFSFGEWGFVFSKLGDGSSDELFHRQEEGR